MTPEEAQETGRATLLVENNLSSVKITHTTKGTTWEVKVKHADPEKAKQIAMSIDDDLAVKYAKIEA